MKILCTICMRSGSKGVKNKAYRKINGFPLFLTIILAPFPSGLVVYWTINNILTMAQQWVIIKRTKVKTV